MLDLPEPKPTATAAGQAHTTNPLTESVIQAAVNDALRKTFHRDDSPVPLIGSAQPVAQPGRPPMSQKATDASAMMIAGGFLSLCLGVAVSAVLYFSGTANETVVISMCAAPPATFMALKGLVRSAKRLGPDVHHHHYNGPVRQDNSTTNHRSIWAKTINKK